MKWGIRTRNTITALIHRIFYSKVTEVNNDLLELEDVKIDYYIYEGRFEEGGEIIFIFSKKKLPIGTVDICLRRMVSFRELVKNYPIDLVILNRMFRRINFGKFDTLDQVLDAPMPPCFYEAIDEIPEEEYSKLLKWKSKRIERLFNLFIDGGWNIDPKLRYVARAYVPYFRLKDFDYKMKYQPHLLMVTNPKTGKSSIFGRIGHISERATISALLGFSGAKKSEVRFGELHRKMKTFAIDEILEDKGRRLYTHLLTIMELGKTTIVRGAVTTKVETVSPIVFITNPKITTEEEEEEMQDKRLLAEECMNRFMMLLDKITDNVKAFASRLGMVIFVNNWKVAKLRRDITPKEKQIIKKVTSYILEKTLPVVDNLLYNSKVTAWLNQELNKMFLDEAKQIIWSMGNPTIREFWRGLLIGYRHIRGFILRQAIMDMLPTIFKQGKLGRKGIIELLNFAKGHEQEVYNLLLESMKTMSTVDVSDRYYEELIMNVEPTWLRGIVWGLMLYLYENGKVEGDEVLWDKGDKEKKRLSGRELKDYAKRVFKYLVSRGFHGKHWLKDTTKSTRKLAYNPGLIEKFGFICLNRVENVEVLISNKSKVKKLYLNLLNSGILDAISKSTRTTHTTYSTYRDKECISSLTKTHVERVENVEPADTFTSDGTFTTKQEQIIVEMPPQEQQQEQRGEHAEAGERGEQGDKGKEVLKDVTIKGVEVEEEIKRKIRLVYEEVSDRLIAGKRIYEQAKKEGWSYVPCRVIQDIPAFIGEQGGKQINFEGAKAGELLSLPPELFNYLLKAGYIEPVEFDALSKEDGEVREG